MIDLFPYSGQVYKITMSNGLTVTNSYSQDGKTVKVSFLTGPLEGSVMEIDFTWRNLGLGNFLLSWQENDKNTVVHCDNFHSGKSFAFYTTMHGDFFQMEGKIEPIQ